MKLTQEEIEEIINKVKEGWKIVGDYEDYFIPLIPEEEEEMMLELQPLISQLIRELSCEITSPIVWMWVEALKLGFFSYMLQWGKDNNVPYELLERNVYHLLPEFYKENNYKILNKDKHYVIVTKYDKQIIAETTFEETN
jgi:hypothetical protein